MNEANKNAPKKTTSSSIWGGRFAGGPSQLMTDINASISYDRAMYKQDIAGSVAHATMLASQNIISEADLMAIRDGLAKIEQEITDGDFAFIRTELVEELLVVRF